MSSKYRIVYIVNSFETGGAEVGMCRLLNGLKPNKYDITVVSITGENDELVERIPAWTHTIKLNAPRGIIASPLREFLSKLRQADMIVGSLFHAALLAKAVGLVNPRARIVIWQHNERFKNKLRKTLFSRVARRSDLVLADSRPVADMLIEDVGITESAIRTIPIAGIDLERFKPMTHEGSEEISVGTIGRLAPQKNHSMVLDVAEKLQNLGISFKIAGEGELFDSLQTEINRRNIENVSLLGRVSDVGTFLQSLDIYFQPSLWEGLCISVLEAMAVRLPVVGSFAGGIGRNVEQGESGYLYEPDDIDGFVSGIRRLSTDPELRNRFGRRGREIVAQSFTQEALVRKFEEEVVGEIEDGL